MILNATITGSSFEGLNQKTQERIYINGSVDAKNQIVGYYSTWNVFAPDQKSKYEFVIQEDSSLDAKEYWEKYFKALEREQARDNKFIISKTTAYGIRMRTSIEKMAKEEDVSFVVKGRVSDFTGHPVGNVALQLSTRAYDPDGPMGMIGKITYVTSSKDGFFESEALSGHSLNISYEGKQYQRLNESFHGKEKLRELKDKTIIIKLESHTESQ